jgi:hypothetical protein
MQPVTPSSSVAAGQRVSPEGKWLRVLKYANTTNRPLSKLRLAARLRTEITLSIKAMARRVHLGTSKSANIRLLEWMKGSAASAPVPSPAKERT